MVQMENLDDIIVDIVEEFGENMNLIEIARMFNLPYHLVIEKISIRKAGFDSRNEYKKHSIKQRGFKSLYVYQEHLAKAKGFESYTEQQEHLAKARGFESLYKYHEHLAREKGFESYPDYEKYLARKKQKKVEYILFSLFLEEITDDLEITKFELAEILEVDRSMVTRYFQGKSLPKKKVMDRLFSRLDIPYQDLEDFRNRNSYR